LFLAFFSILVVWLFSEGYNFSYIWFIFALMVALPQILLKADSKNYEYSN